MRSMNFEKKFRAYAVLKIALILAMIFYREQFEFVVALFVFIMLTYVMDNIFINEIMKSRENNKKQPDKE